MIQPRGKAGQTPNIRPCDQAVNTQGPIMNVVQSGATGNLGRRSPVGLRGGNGRRHTLAERLSARTVKTDTCWLAQGYRTGRGGYVQIVVDPSTNRRDYVHRVAWMLANGQPSIPAGGVILHSCDNPICVNPAHLSLGSQADNIRDSHAKGRFTAWHRTGRRLNGEIPKSLIGQQIDQNHALQPQLGGQALDVVRLSGDTRSARVRFHERQSAASTSLAVAVER